MAQADLLSKVPQITLNFWVIKILATTLGETGGDAVSMSLDLGYAMASLLFLVFFAIMLSIQLNLKSFHPLAYWGVVVATTTVGTTLSDFMDRTLEFGYIKSSVILFALTIIALIAWRVIAGKIEYSRILRRRDEFFYWLTILLANTLGTALGDCIADDVGLGFVNGAIVFAVLIAITYLGFYFIRAIPSAVWFWMAYILTRPLGATVGDTLTKSAEIGGFDLGRIQCSFIILMAMLILIGVVYRGHIWGKDSGEKSRASAA